MVSSYGISCLQPVSGTQEHIAKAGFPERTMLSGGRGEVSELSIFVSKFRKKAYLLSNRPRQKGPCLLKHTALSCESILVVSSWSITCLPAHNNIDTVLCFGISRSLVTRVLAWSLLWGLP
jgi:hypothetical protein